MKKILVLIISLCLLLPATVLADTQALDLKSTVESVGLTFKGEDYKETDEQVMVYLFRWTTCDHCHNAISYFNDLIPEHGDKFKMRSFETSANQDNDELKKKIAKFMDLEAPGVPLIIIGENSFYGFSDDTKDKILQAIDNVYNSTEKYDVFDEMEKDQKSNNNTAVIIIITIIAVAGIGLTVLFMKKNR